jgi:DNA-binding SARP family transcriptional activator
VVALRAGKAADRLPGLDLPPPKAVRSALDVRWATELAVGLNEVGRRFEARSILDVLGPAGRAALRELTGGGGGGRPARALLAAAPAPPPEPSYLAVLGPMVLRRGAPDAEPVADPHLRRNRVRALLAFLVGHRRTTRAAIMATLWPDLAERAASNNLAVTFSHLLRLLEPWRDAGEPGYLLRVEGAAVHLVTGPHLEVDVDTFERHLADAAAAEADGVPSLALDHDLAAVALYRHDLHTELPDADWLTLEREHYRTRFVGAATRAAQLLLSRGDIDEAEDVAHRALTVDQWSEEAYAVLVGAALARRDRSSAHRLLTRCLAILADLDVQPSLSTRQLQRRLHNVTA